MARVSLLMLDCEYRLAMSIYHFMTMAILSVDISQLKKYYLHNGNRYTCKVIFRYGE